MSEYGSFSDDYYVNMNLSTEMELPQNREAVLHYFEQVRRRYPKMLNFYSRDKGEYVLEEERCRLVSLGLDRRKRVNEVSSTRTRLIPLSNSIEQFLNWCPLNCQSVRLTASHSA